MASETTVGNIVGYLRLDDSQWNRTLAEAGASADALGSSSPNIEVSADTGAADAALAVTGAEADRIGREHPTIDVDANTTGAEANMARAEHSTVGLMDAIVLLGPAMVPIAGAAVGLGAAFAGLGGVGVLAVLGIKKELSAGTVEGARFQAAIDTLQGNLGRLEATAASGVLAPFEQVVKSLQPKMPALNSGVQTLSHELGQVAVPAADGLATAILDLLPTMTEAAQYAIQGARAFDQWAHTDGLQKFGAYAMAVLPQVMATLQELIPAAGSVVAAFAPFGGTVLSALQLLASTINAVPIGVLQTLATTGVSVYVAFKSWNVLSSLVGGVGSAVGSLSASLGRLGASSAASQLQGVARGLTAVETAGSIANLAVGGIAGVLGVATLAWSIYQQRQQAAKQAQEEMTQAIQEDSGAIGDNTQKILAKSIADGNMLQNAQSLGISQDQLTAAIARGGPALDQVNSLIEKNGMVSKTSSGAAQNLAGDQKVLSGQAIGLRDGISKLNGEITKGKKSYDANKIASKAMADQLDSTKQQTTSLQLSQMSEATATDAQKKAIDALNQSLDAELSKELQLQGGLTGEAQARLQMDSVLKKNSDSVSLNTSKGVANRQAIEQSVGQLQTYRDAQVKAGKSTADATTTYESQAASLLKNIASTDGANSATYKYAAQLLKVPKDVTTKVGTSGTSVSVTQLKGLQGIADKLGVTRVNIPTGTPNAKNTAQLLNNISDAALSADGKSVSIPTASATAVATKLKLDGISGAAVTANGKSVTVPTKTLNSAKTLGEITSILDTAQDKTMTTNANMAHYNEVLGQIDSLKAAASDKSFTITANYVNHVSSVIDKIGKSVGGHAAGTYAGGSAGGVFNLAEQGAELVMDPTQARLAAGTIVLNHNDTMRTMAGDPGPLLRATGGTQGAVTNNYFTVNGMPGDSVEDFAAAVNYKVRHASTGKYAGVLA